MSADDTSQYPSAVELRNWARSRRAGSSVNLNGRLPKFVILAWNKAFPDRPYVASQAHHGTATGYRNHDCRCDRCLEAGRRYQRERRHEVRNAKDDELADALTWDDRR